ncbi:hypothetical protein EV361DRAFT_167244 [Lentinula raphanica]|nr:hypothetical protein EV360DRAFT_79437 [Lentinula raphanica]KAJ3773475.1 hypothetical protein FB446DRAFT_703034 [Lentinula raphanica]KAJ3816782.1 hypothetical protein F5880DRAFT_1618936 [Lentinula raphanica]KAJ3972117.1 hypothetical protein EV361DRAFT_167244 [Lentinula raphanica]
MLFKRLFSIVPAVVLGLAMITTNAAPTVECDTCGGTGTGTGTTPPNNNGGSCNTGSLDCCNNVEEVTGANSGALESVISALLGTTVDLPISSVIGIGCNAILGLNECKQQTVCCTGTSFSGLINLGCSPINIL